MNSTTDAELEAFLDEALRPDEMADLEQELRNNPELLQRLSQINSRRDAGVHTLGEIWRHNRISCPTREQLGSFLLDALGPEDADYIRFHVDLGCCTFCRSNLEDMRRQQQEAADSVVSRRKKYFQSSAGYLKRS